MRACIHGQTARSVRLKWLTRGSGLPPLNKSKTTKSDGQSRTLRTQCGQRVSSVKPEVKVRSRFGEVKSTHSTLDKRLGAQGPSPLHKPWVGGHG